MKDVWKNIPGYQGKYQVSINGKIRRVYESGKTRLLHPYQKRRAKGSNRYLVRLTKDGKTKEEVFIKIMALTFLGEPPEGCIPYHKNFVQSDNYIQNIAYINKHELGKLTGGKARRRPVIKIDRKGNIIDAYGSAREAARKNFMCYQTVMDRCNGKCKSPYAPDGFAYAWEDSNVSIRKAKMKIEQCG